MNQVINDIIQRSFVYDRQNDSDFFDKQKFARLLIQECISVSAIPVNGSKSAEWQAGYKKSQLDSHLTIKDYFGLDT